MKTIYLIDSEPQLNAPICRFLPRDVIEKIYPLSNQQKLKYIFKYKTPKEIPEPEAVELLKRLPTLSIVDSAGLKVVDEVGYERLKEFSLTGEEGRDELIEILRTLLQKVPKSPSIQTLKDLIEAQLVQGKFPLTEAGMAKYNEDQAEIMRKYKEKIKKQKSEFQKAEMAKLREKQDVNVS